MAITFVSVTQRELKIFQLLGGEIFLHLYSREDPPILSFSAEPGLVKYRTDRALIGIWASNFDKLSEKDMKELIDFLMRQNSYLRDIPSTQNCWILICH